MTVTQKAKNRIKVVKVSNGWKNKPGSSPKHFALSLNNAVIKLIRLRNTKTSNNSIIYKIQILLN